MDGFYMLYIVITNRDLSYVPVLSTCSEVIYTLLICEYKIRISVKSNKEEGTGIWHQWHILDVLSSYNLLCWHALCFMNDSWNLSPRLSRSLAQDSLLMKTFLFVIICLVLISTHVLVMKPILHMNTSKTVFDSEIQMFWQTHRSGIDLRLLIFLKDTLSGKKSIWQFCPFWEMSW